MPGKPEEIKMVSNAMANVPRRKMMAFLAGGERTSEEIGEAVGKSMLDYHLKILEQAGLIEIGAGKVRLSEFGKNFMETKVEKPKDAVTDLSGGEARRDHGGEAAPPLHRRLDEVSDHRPDGPTPGRRPEAPGAAISEG